MKKIQQIDRRRQQQPLTHRNQLIRTNSDDFFTKLERIRLSTTAASSSRKFIRN